MPTFSTPLPSKLRERVIGLFLLFLPAGQARFFLPVPSRIGADKKGESSHFMFRCQTALVFSSLSGGNCSAKRKRSRLFSPFLYRLGYAQARVILLFPLILSESGLPIPLPPLLLASSISQTFPSPPPLTLLQVRVERSDPPVSLYVRDCPSLSLSSSGPKEVRRSFSKPSESMMAVFSFPFFRLPRCDKGGFSSFFPPFCSLRDSLFPFLCRVE